MHGLRRSDSEPVATGHNLRIAVWNHSLTCSGVSLMYVCYRTYMQHTGWLRLFSRVFVTIFEGLFWGWADPHSRPPHASFFRSWPTDDSNGTQGGVCLLLQGQELTTLVGQLILPFQANSWFKLHIIIIRCSLLNETSRQGPDLRYPQTCGQASQSGRCAVAPPRGLVK